VKWWCSRGRFSCIFRTSLHQRGDGR
jgi:hypothetical protein